ncbi:MAG: peptidylprolyl isomerase [Alphaproteobacteria bacterium]
MLLIDISYQPVLAACRGWFAHLGRSCVLAVGLLAAAAGPSHAQELLRAAAVVNDEIISMLDLNMRVRLAILATGQQNTAEARQRIVPQVIRGLIDERLQSQEAERLAISVPDEQLDGAIDRLASRNKMTRETFLGTVEQQGILRESLLEQIRAQLVWRTLIARRLRPSVHVSEEEIQEIINRIVTNRGGTLRRVSEIFLAVDSVLQEDDVRVNAERLLNQIRAGADFTALARQFSHSATAPQGGEIGWVQEGQLAPEIDAALAGMQDGTISGPIRTLSGFHILLLRKSRKTSLGDVSLHIKQVLLPLPGDATDEQQQETEAHAAEVRKQINGCGNVEEIATEAGASESGDLGTMKLGDLPDPIQNIVRSLPIGQPSEPIRVTGGLSVLVVCERTDAGIDRDAIHDQLLNSRLDLLSRRYMRDLRRSANVDIRI